MGSRKRQDQGDGVPPVVRYWRESLPGGEPERAPPRIRTVDTCAGHRPRTGYYPYTDPDNAR